MLLALKSVISDFVQIDKRTIYHQDLLKHIRDQIEPYIKECRHLYAGTLFAIKFVKNQIGIQGQNTKNLVELKKKLIEQIDEFIKEKIIYAQDILINQGLKIFNEKREEVIMIYANQESQTVVDLLKKAHDKGIKIRVVVVDSAPEFHGRSMVKRLAKHGIKCQYTLINLATFVINQVSKVILPATYILCNGALVSPMGSSILASLAKQFHIPVVAVCETYKFEDRVNLDQISNNQQGDARKFMFNYLKKNQDPQPLDSAQNQLNIFNLKMDLTPQKYLGMIVCEIGNIPSHSVPVVIKEMQSEFEQEQKDEDSSEEEDQSEKDEIDEEEEEKNPFEHIQQKQNSRMMDRRRQLNLEMETVEEDKAEAD